MIKANELRIGNWIKRDENEYEQVDGGFLSHDMTMSGISEVEGVDLTPEILEKAGFKVTDDNPKQKQQYEGDVIFNIGDFEFSNSEKGQNGGFYCWQINNGETIYKYVHQLQNLYFALSGEELTITL